MDKLITGLAGAAGGALTELLGQSFGPPVSTLIIVICAVAGTCLVLTGFRYYAILGASESRWDTQEYRTYAALRRRLRRGVRPHGSTQAGSGSRCAGSQNFSAITGSGGEPRHTSCLA